ncbi:CRISPR-associated endonuclease Cas3'' [Amaricoccus sp.]|uniref:CRISPR-associated endonuclease Cas3'' n=1 Tax=Amaricoccus sp. TaxID=1872485 RepID=UPI001D2FD03D|nr:CRISPR-associated endonuclease Cas3'' [Amaricoccus sp.]MCC0067990.1 CRISPR-associated endonuclease Cas3'' [Rhodovulum sp.]HRW16525.1 CRISPR-associated endonuclease Cas3'' [Amaricoccus sp.]
MTLTFLAHSASLNSTCNGQPLTEHLRAVAGMAAEGARPLGIERAAHCVGLLHDLGKYHPDFQRRLAGAAVRVDHSTAGGAILLREADARDRIAAEALAYCILGHHAGLPDKMNGTETSLARRLETFADGLDPSWRREIAVDLDGVGAELVAKASGESRVYPALIGGSEGGDRFS